MKIPKILFSTFSLFLGILTSSGVDYAGMVAVQGGTLPQGSELGGQMVETFQIGKYEVTWGEWKSVRDWAVANGYGDLAGVGEGSADNHPVHSVGWYDVVKWSNAKSEMEGLTPVYELFKPLVVPDYIGYTGPFEETEILRTGEPDESQFIRPTSGDGYRLPLEKEWEWAARGGILSQGYPYSGSNDINAVAWHNSNSSSGTKGVGTKVANELSIYDMSGNVWEWCWSLNDTYSFYRQIRGGSMGVTAGRGALSDRGDYIGANNRFADTGFRLARNAAGSPESEDEVVQIQADDRFLSNAEKLDIGEYALENYGQTFSPGLFYGEGLFVPEQGPRPIQITGGGLTSTGYVSYGFLPMQAQSRDSISFNFGKLGIDAFSFSPGGPDTIQQHDEVFQSYEVTAESSSGKIYKFISTATQGISIKSNKGSISRVTITAYYDPSPYRNFIAGGIATLSAVRSSNLVAVQGGTLPQGSELVGQVVGDFQIGKYEVTWGEWKAVSDWAVANGYSDLAGVGDTYPSGSADSFPVGFVSWYDVVKWCNAKSEMEGLTPVHQVGGSTYRTGQSVPTVNSVANGYRLPLEKEWEWAARGGIFSNGYVFSGGNDLGEVAWWLNNSDSSTNVVGRKIPNELGIFDMTGNVREMTWSNIRGGDWTIWNPSLLVINQTFSITLNQRDASTGFRLVRNAGTPDTTAAVITLNGANPQTVYKGSTYTDPAALVTDDVDAPQTIQGSGTVSTSVLGVYMLTYAATDAAGNAAQPVTRTINVVLDPNGDEDGDGLSNSVETNSGAFVSATDTGTNPLVADTNSDGFRDGEAVGAGLNPLTNYAGAISLVKQLSEVTPGRFDLYTADATMDLNLGALTIQKNGQMVTVELQLQSTTDLATQPFTNLGAPVEFQMEMPSNKGFLRVHALGSQ